MKGKLNEDRYDFDSSSSCESDNEKVRKFEIAKKLFFEILVIWLNEVVSFYRTKSIIFHYLSFVQV